MSNGAKLVTCPIHWWSGPNVSIVENAVACCWEGHVIDPEMAQKLVAS